MTHTAAIIQFTGTPDTSAIQSMNIALSKHGAALTIRDSALVLTVDCQDDPEPQEARPGFAFPVGTP
jgi:hypothetical protein